MNSVVFSFSTVNDDTVYDCLLKLDISLSRHVLGETNTNECNSRKREKKKKKKREDDTQKDRVTNEKKRKGLRKKVRDYGRSLLS